MKMTTAFVAVATVAASAVILHAAAQIGLDPL